MPDARIARRCGRRRLGIGDIAAFEIDVAPE
jgi:hypothetical protein